MDKRKICQNCKKKRGKLCVVTNNFIARKHEACEKFSSKGGDK